jgi:hypothetical protein
VIQLDSLPGLCCIDDGCNPRCDKAGRFHVHAVTGLVRHDQITMPPPGVLNCASRGPAESHRQTALQQLPPSGPARLLRQLGLVR